MSKYTLMTLGVLLCMAAVAVAQPQATLDTSFQVRYTANLNLSDATVRITNTGAHDDSICVNVYGFDITGEFTELTSCCSCLIQPNGLRTLSVWHNLLLDSPPVSPPPNEVVIKLLATQRSLTSACDAGHPGPLEPGLAAWGTTPQPSGFFNSPPLIT